MLDIGHLIRSGPCKRFSAGQRITFLFGKNNTERVMYVLVTGKVDVFTGETRDDFAPAGSIFPGEVFGGREFFLGSDDATYIADVDSVAFILSAQSFKKLAGMHPDVLFEVLRAAYVPMGAFVPRSEFVQGETVPDDPGGTDADEAPDSPARTQIDASAEIFPEGHKGYPGITKPEYANMTFKKEYACPLCKKTFAGRKVSQSKLFETRSMRFDLRKYYRDFQPEWYDVVTCPNCYFSMHYSYFQENRRVIGAKIESGISAARASVTLDFGAERDIDFVFASHYLALVCAPGYAATYWQICAKIWGNLSWLYEDVGDEEMMRLAAENAAEAYERVFMESSLTPVKEQVACLSIAGMLYRAGKTEDGNLKKYLYKAKTMNSGNKVYASLAEDLMELLRDESDASKSGASE